jgi:hypothetical protein
MQPHNCLNCENELLTGQNFCAGCGQTATVHRLTTHDVVHEALHYFTHADKGILILIKELATRPGQVARQFIAGKRKRYFSPLSFFLLVAGFYVFMMTTLNKGSHSVIPAEQRAAAAKIPDQKIRAKVLAAFDRSDKAINFINHYSNFVSMFAIPLITFFVWLFYLKGRYNYTEHLIANLYITGFTSLCYASILAPIGKLLHLGQANYLIIVYFIFEITYRSISYYYFMHKGTRSSAVKATAVSFTVALAWMLISGSLMFFYMKNGLWGLLS